MVHLAVQQSLMLANVGVCFSFWKLLTILPFLERRAGLGGKTGPQKGQGDCRGQCLGVKA